MEIEKLKAEDKALKIENAQLKEKLDLNSKSSSIPGSKELCKIRKSEPKKTQCTWRLVFNFCTICT